MSRNLYAEVTTRILAELKAGVVPWHQPWSTTPGRNTPCNAVTNREYHGVNRVLLFLARARGWPAPRFLTFKQALEAGGHVRKGEHGTKIYFVKDYLKFEESEVEGDDPVAQHRHVLREYTVFNVAQCEGLPARITELPPPRVRHRDGRDPLIDEFLTTTGASIIEDGNEAMFVPSRDIITIPSFLSFDSASAYYGVLFHELAHWTGHPARLNRELGSRFGKDAYVGEELIAELGAAFLCAEFDIDGDPRLSGYVMHYIRLLEGDPKAFFTAASKAQQAVDYLRDLAIREPAEAAE